MAESTRPPQEPEKSPPADAPSESILVCGSMKIPEADAPRIIPGLGLAFGCGGARARKRRGMFEIEAILELRELVGIVEKGVPVLVTKRIPVEPIPEAELMRSAEAWLEMIGREE
jgi:hypothetical protein